MCLAKTKSTSGFINIRCSIFQRKRSTKYKDYFIITRSICQKDSNSLKMFAPNNRDSNYLNKKLIKFQGEKDKRERKKTNLQL